MKQAKHTPAPWRHVTLGRNKVTFHAIVADHPTHPRSDEDVPGYGGHLVAESVIEANANLIAAAPELVAALEGFLAIVDQTHGHAVDENDGWALPMWSITGWRREPAVAAARAALAKARGEP